MMNIMTNPFVVGDYTSRNLFCGRERERTVLMQEILAEHNIALIGPWRIGKNSLLTHTFSFPDVKDNYDVISLNISNCKSLTDFTAELRNVVNKKIQSRGSDFNIPKRMSLNGIMTFLSNNVRPVIICINEFQRITQFKEDDAQLKIQSLVMNYNSIRFIFCGSDIKEMEELFMSALNPFYKKATLIRLEPIELMVYTEFAQHAFDLGRKHVTSEMIEKIYNRFDGITWYMQMVLHVLYNMTPANSYSETPMIELAIEQIIDYQRYAYQEIYKKINNKPSTIPEDKFFEIWLEEK